MIEAGQDCRYAVAQMGIGHGRDAQSSEALVGDGIAAVAFAADYLDILDTDRPL